MSQTVEQIGERGVIALVERFLSPARDRVLVSAGDDCAAIRTPPIPSVQVLTTDLLVQGTHFLRNADTNWELLGRKAIVANISDLAAMGAMPESLLTAIGLPADFPVSALEQLYQGLREESDKCGAALVGGDTVRCSHVLISITATGLKAEKDGSCLRSNCTPGQHVYVSGALGGCRAGLELTLNNEYSNLRDAAFAVPLIRRMQVPEPRIPLGRYIAMFHRDAAVIDISDGLANELRMLAAASQCGFQLRLNNVPVFEGVAEFCAQLHLNPHQFALFSGEEYELLFCCAATPDELRKGVGDAGIGISITEIGRVTEKPGITFLSESGTPIHLRDESFQHF